MTPPRSFDRSIVDGPITAAVWKIAWPTMLANVISGLQGLVDHIMVGHYVGFTGNAAIGVSWQIFLVVMIFMNSLFIGMGVLVARFTGANDSRQVNRSVYQAFLTAVALALGVLAPVGYVLAPSLLTVVNATPAVQAEALPYLRIMFLFSLGMLVFFMLSGALRAAGDARTPLRYGVALTILNLILNVILIRGLGPIPAFGTAGAAMGTVIAGILVALAAGQRLFFSHHWVIHFERGLDLRPDWAVIRELFRFGIPAGIQGVVMNIGGVVLLAFVGSLPRSGQAQAAYAVGYTQLFSLVTWTAVGLMGATAAVAGQNLGAKRPDRSVVAVRVGTFMGLAVAATVGCLFLTIPRVLLGIFGLEDPAVMELGSQLLAFLSLSGLLVTVALSYTGGLQGTGDTKGPLYISLASQVVVPIGICAVTQMVWGLQAWHIWFAILVGHASRATLSVLRFRQGAWRTIKLKVEPAA